MSPPMRARSDERGASLSAFVVVIVAALILVAGLVVDGGQQTAATRRAGAVAAGAARAGADAAAASVIAGRPLDVALATRAATTYLAASPRVHGNVVVRDGGITVTTTTTAPTVFLSVIGIDTVTGHGHATQILRSSTSGPGGPR